MCIRKESPLDPRKGAVLPLVAVAMVALVGFAALAVDVGYMYTTRNELQNVADGCALAATRRLGNIYQGMSYEAQQGYICSGTDADAVRTAAHDVAGANYAGGSAMAVRVEDVKIGNWDTHTRTFTEGSLEPDAVQVIARRDGTFNGPISTFFARVFGTDEVSVTASATAALTGQSTAGDGDLELPIGIARYFFENPSRPFCNEDIQFYPTNDPASCAGWTSWDFGANDVTLRHILAEDPGYENPDTTAGETAYEFTGGTLSNPTFDALLSLFQVKGCDVVDNVSWDFYPPGSDETNCAQQAPPGEGQPLYELNTDGTVKLDASGNPIRLYYPDGTPRNYHKWITGVVVYDLDDCSNPNQSVGIVGFAEIELRDVLNAPDKLVRGFVKCNYVGPGPERGGGGEYGVKGSIPGLVL